MKSKKQLSTRISNLGFSRILTGYLVLILLFAVIYFLLSGTTNNGIYKRDTQVIEKIDGFGDAIYFSFVTSTSLGYGDIVPKGLSRIFAISEVFSSLIIFGVLISKLLNEKQEKILQELYEVSFQERFNRILIGLYNFRAETESIFGRLAKLNAKEKEELVQMIESNLHLFSSYLNDCEKIFSDREKIPEEKVELILDNLHSSIAKLDELAAMLKSQKIKWKSKYVLNSMASIYESTEKVCKQCSIDNYRNIADVVQEVKRHAEHLRGV